MIHTFKLWPTRAPPCVKPQLYIVLNKFSISSCLITTCLKLFKKSVFNLQSRFIVFFLIFLLIHWCMLKTYVSDNEAKVCTSNSCKPRLVDVQIIAQRDHIFQRWSSEAQKPLPPAVRTFGFGTGSQSEQTNRQSFCFLGIYMLHL